MRNGHIISITLDEFRDLITLESASKPLCDIVALAMAALDNGDVDYLHIQITKE